MNIIELEGMEFYSKIGCLEHEKLIPNLFKVDFKAEADLSRAGKSDNLEDSVDYSKIYDLIKEEMSKSCNLIENVCFRISTRIEKEFPTLQNFSIKIAKKSPPVNGKVEWSKISFIKRNDR